MQQQGHSNPCPMLPDIIQQAPALLGWLPPRTRAALSGCNRQLRTFFRSITTTVVVGKFRHLTSLRSCDWPVLEVVVLPNPPSHLRLQHTYGDQFQLAAMCHMPRECLSEYVGLFLLRPQQNQEEHSPPSQQMSTALLHLQQPQYAELQSLTLCCTHLDEHQMKLMSDTWSKLTSLTLSSVKLDSTAARCLGTGSWPALRQLDLSNCGLDTGAMAELVGGQWPELYQLNLSANPLLEGAAISLLTSANWPDLSSVQLRCMELKPGSFDWLLQKPWGNLCHLDLRWTNLSASLVSELAQTDIARIQILDLAGNDLGSDAMRALTTALMLDLHTLDLSQNNLDAEAAQWLSRGEWSELMYLKLDDNLLDNAAMEQLAQAWWCNMSYLSLSVSCNPFNSDGLQSLIQGYWSRLFRLELDIELANAATWDILDLEPSCLIGLHTKVKGMGSLSVPRSKDENKVLSNLPFYPEILFCYCPTSRLEDGNRRNRQYSGADVGYL